MPFVLPKDRIERQKVLVEVARGHIVEFEVEGKKYVITPRSARNQPLRESVDKTAIENKKLKIENRRMVLEIRKLKSMIKKLNNPSG